MVRKMNPMNEDLLKKLIRDSAVHGAERTVDCPGENVLAAALDGRLKASERAEFEAHASGCSYCIEVLARISRISASVEDEPVSEFVLARARRLAQKLNPIYRYSRWAAAAVVVLSVIFVAAQFKPVATGTGLGTGPDRQVRNTNPDAYRPGILFPKEGTSIGVDGSVFRWSAVPDCLHYDVRVVAGDGSLLWQERVTDTQWRIPGDLQLVPGEDYYFRVDAYLAAAKSVNSPHVLFRIKSQD